MSSAFPVLLFLGAVLACWAGEKCEEANSNVILTEGVFGYIKRQAVKIYTWENSNGMVLEVITYGGRIRSIKMPDKYGNVDDIVLGYDKLEDYKKDKTYFGAVLGRTANRIVNASYTLDGKKYNLTANQNGDTFHGGTIGFSHVIFEPYVSGTTLTLSYYSPDGQDGYGGDVLVQVTYELTEDNTVVFKVRATTTKPTPITIGNHAYYNLAGHDAGPEETYKHLVNIVGENIVKYDSAGRPTGEIENVKNTCNDFLTVRNLGDMIKECGSYDVYFCMNRNKIGDVIYVAGMGHEESGRILKVLSNQPGLLFYTGANLSKYDQVIGKGGAKYIQNGSICFETHGYPDAVNHPNFESVILNPGEQYVQNTFYKFSTRYQKEAYLK